MQILLDTHTLIWALEDNPKLSQEAKDLITDLNNTIFVSSASIWEIAIKSARQNFPYNAEEMINLCSRVGFRFIAIGLNEIKVFNSLKVKENEIVNNDPFDKILIAQAKVNEMKFLTHDHLIKKYDENCIIAY